MLAVKGVPKSRFYSKIIGGDKTFITTEKTQKIIWSENFFNIDSQLCFHMVFIS